MSELKTLKDFDILICPKDAQVPQIIEAYNKMLKAEAVKWVRFYNRQYKDKSWKEHILVPLILFFNLTEEELKGGIEDEEDNKD